MNGVFFCPWAHPLLHQGRYDIATQTITLYGIYGISGSYQIPHQDATSALPLRVKF